MAVPQMIAVSLPGSGTSLLADVTGTLGYTSYGTMSGDPAAGAGHPGPGEVYSLLTAAYGPDRTALLLNPQHDRESLEIAFHQAVGALWRVWWTRLGQPTTLHSPVDPDTESRLARLPDTTLLTLLPGRGCWYVTGLDLHRADADFLRSWHTRSQPPIVYHHRDIRDRIISQIRALSQPGDRVGSLPEHLIYRDILATRPTLDAKITLALTDPGFPGMREAHRGRWLLHHPAICVITHEELAGPALGGTTDARERALTRLLHATGHPAPPDAADFPPPPADGADDLAVGIGRELFTPAHEDLLRHHHSALLPPDPPGATPRNAGTGVTAPAW
ncbi:hypothetical protein ACFT9I_11865 [Streptomyces sp. NPDC057137]|uniref:hypothetical protein n=1 Tax=Streptomyces sp. NPDC057137 TaxID=3346030 RepID=UPI0036413623